MNPDRKKCLPAHPDSNSITAIDAVPVPCFQPMVCLKGDLDTISQAFEQFPPRDEHTQPVWLDIEVAGGITCRTFRNAFRH